MAAGRRGAAPTPAQVAARKAAATRRINKAVTGESSLPKGLKGRPDNQETLRTLQAIGLTPATMSDVTRDLLDSPPKVLQAWREMVRLGDEADRVGNYTREGIALRFQAQDQQQVILDSLGVDRREMIDWARTGDPRGLIFRY